MSAADWVIVLGLVLSVALAVSQGFFLEVFSLAGVVVGFLLASWDYHLVSAHLSFISPPWAADIAGFLVIFLVTAILAGVIGRIASWGMKQVGLRWIDRALGGVFGLLRGALVVTFTLMAVAAFAPQTQWLQKSNLAPYFLVVGRAASWLTPPQVRHRVQDGVELLHRGKVEEQDAKAPAGISTEPDKKQVAPGGK
ncbi:MAG TPA: CvpA family protein [Terriglobales bacterium]|nr:CvpA family protein [Terriglobales bacterium]